MPLSKTTNEILLKNATKQSANTVMSIPYLHDVNSLYGTLIHFDMQKYSHALVVNTYLKKKASKIA